MNIFSHGTRAALVTGLMLAALPAAAQITVTDLRGREVTITEPAQHVLLGFYYEDFLAVTGAGAVDRIAALSRGPWADWRPEQWAAYTAAFPSLAQLPDVGDTEASTFSVEAAIAVQPDLVLLAGWQYDSLGQSIQQFDAAGIPVVVLDYNAQTLEAHLASTRVLGAVMGQTERAEELAAFYEEMMADTRARVEAAGPIDTTVYVELAQKGPDEIGNTYGRGMWAGVIEQLGGHNIAAGQIENWGPLSPEYTLAAQPDVILLAGSEWRNRPAAVLLGWGADPSLANERMAAYLTRPGWETLPAAQEGQVYGIYHGGARTLSDFAYFRFVAKILHPEAFADVDPAAELTAYYARWMPVQPQGLFVTQLQQ
ncbi:ABC transporter substrate-binding protein [Pararhodobacter sp. CCB-MM2]|uniref:ABC transporter substrate-binding protein n=1 Tax=Pararhodobacter sp. CCB-MM2 TaxID=1786003 RepID=UPI00082A22EB|nr:ABC transporter substrate-binding protein [Pararhodobacter sp. CCB-MM2]